MCNRFADNNGHLRVAGERLKGMGERGRKPCGCLWDAESLRRGPRGSRAGGPTAVVGVDAMFGGIGSWDTVARCRRISSRCVCKDLEIRGWKLKNGLQVFGDRDQGGPVESSHSFRSARAHPELRRESQAQVREASTTML